jgi:hypothetical protein
MNHDHQWYLHYIIWKNRIHVLLQWPTRKKKHHNKMLLFISILSVITLLVVVLLLPRLQLRMPFSRNNNGRQQHWLIAPRISISSRSMDSIRIKNDTIKMSASHMNNVDYSRVVCLTDACLQRGGQRLARAFPDHHFHSWCVSKKQQHAAEQQQQQQHGGVRFFNKTATTPVREQEEWQGILLVRPYKAASSTLAGVVLRISHRNERRIKNIINTNSNHSSSSSSNDDNCAVQWGHARGQTYRYLTHRSRSKSLLLAPVRRAAARAYSASFYFEPSASGYKSDASLLSDFQLQYRQWPGMYVCFSVFSLACLHAFVPARSWLYNLPRRVNGCRASHAVVLSFIFLQVV